MLIIDSNLSWDEALRDNPESSPAPSFVRKQLRMLDIRYFSYDGKVHLGQIVIHEHIVNQVKAIFDELYTKRIPIAKMVPIASPKYRWDDECSMQDNNSSCYNWRTILGTTKLSLHAVGLAIDINPLWNPWIKGDAVQPLGACYDPALPGTLTADSPIVQIFKKYGFDWAGDWLEERGYVDYQHFGFLHYDTDPIEYLKNQGFI